MSKEKYYYLNGKQQEMDCSQSLANLVEQLGLEQTQIAIAVNQSFVARVEYSNIQIEQDDHIEIVTAMQGG